MGIAGAVGGATSGLVLSQAGYLGLNMAGAVVGAAVLAAAILTRVAQRRQPLAS
jgi:predicted MFS family arabinose efflux permease